MCTDERARFGVGGPISKVVDPDTKVVDPGTKKYEEEVEPAKKYSLVSWQMDWQTAADFCQRNLENGRLVAIRTVEDEKAVQAYLATLRGQYRY